MKKSHIIPLAITLALFAGSICAQGSDVTIWVGLVDGSPISAYVNAGLRINVYFQTTEEAYIADMCFPLGINNGFIDHFKQYNQDMPNDSRNCFYRYLFIGWDSASFDNINEDYYIDGDGNSWDSYSFAGAAELTSPYKNLWLHTEPGEQPILGLTFIVRIVDDSSLIGQTIDNAIGVGYDPVQGTPIFRDPEGSQLTYDIFFSSMSFKELLYIPGDISMYLGHWPPTIIGGDVSYFVNYFRGSPSSQPCFLGGFWCSADVNGDCRVIGSDITRLINYFYDQNNITFCPDYPPAWDIWEPPENPPPGWPGCEN